MAKGKRQVQRPPARSRTRLHKPKLADPDSSVELDAQLKTLGLKLHNTLGDGNCLFRALSDQLYGTEAHHLTLRADITTWMAKYKDRYEGFVEDDRSFEDHLRCMRQTGTYGGHLELSAFAHLTHKNVKVIQPGLVYVIEWDAGNAFPQSPRVSENDIPPSPNDERETRRNRREKRRSSIEGGSQSGPSGPSPSGGDTVYVAYHDWEHFSSLRTLLGERPIIAYAPTDDDAGPSQPNVPGTYDESLATEPVASTSYAPVPTYPAPINTAPLSSSSSSLAPPQSDPLSSSPTATIKVKRPRGRPRKNPVLDVLPKPPTSPASTSAIGTPASSSAPALPPPTLLATLVPVATPPPRSLSPSATSSASTVASASTAASTSSSSNSSSLPPITPSDSSSLLPSQSQSTVTALSAARTRAYDPTVSRSSPKRQFVDNEDDGNVNGFASEDSETRGAKRRALSSGDGHHRSGSSTGSNLNPLSRVLGGEESESRSTSAPPLSRASSTTTASGTDLSEIEASLVTFDGEGDEDGGGDKNEEDPLKTEEVPITKEGGGKAKKLQSRPKPMNRKERKKLGLPKASKASLSARPRRVILKVNGQRPGAIETPGDNAGNNEAWIANGSGRMDNRGFRELKI